MSNYDVDAVDLFMNILSLPESLRDDLEEAFIVNGIITVEAAKFKGHPWHDVAAYGAIGDDVANDGAALQAAFSAAATGGTVFFPPGTYRFTSDLVVSADNVSIVADSRGAHLHGDGAGLHLNGQIAPHKQRNLIRGIRISRTGVAGPALFLSGGGAGTGVVRWGIDRVWISSSTGTGLKIAGSYLGTITDLVVQSATIGLEIVADPVAGTVFGNAISWHGGEIQGCGQAFDLNTAKGVGLFGVAIEGNTLGGVTRESCVGITLDGCYFEANGGYDLRLGDTGAQGAGYAINGNFFADGTANKDHSIILVRGVAIDISANNFSGYTLKPIRCEEAFTAAVRGSAQNNWDGDEDVVDLNGATRFGQREFIRLATFTHPSAGGGNAQFQVAGDAFPRLQIISGSNGGVIQAGSGSVAADSVLRRGSVGNRWVCEDDFEIDGALDHDGTTIGEYGATPVAKSTGWGTPTGTTDKTTFDTATVTLSELAERVKAMIDYFTSRGSFGA